MSHTINSTPSEDERRAARYWVTQMEQGLAFLQRILAQPIEESGEPLVDIGEVAAERGVAVAFSDKPHAAGRPRLFLARPEVVDQILAVAAELQAADFTLVIEDAFRTAEMQRDLALSDAVIRTVASISLLADPDSTLEAMVERLSVVVQTRPKGAGHMAGAAVDVSVRSSGGEDLDRGGPYLTVSEVMPMDSPFVGPEAARNRRFITETMQRHGFEAYPFEFWHYSSDDIFARLIAADPAPARYGPVELGPGGAVTSIPNELDSLHGDCSLADHFARVVERDRPA